FCSPKIDWRSSRGRYDARQYATRLKGATMCTNHRRLLILLLPGLALAAFLWWLLDAQTWSAQPVVYAAGVHFVAPGGNCGGPTLAGLRITGGDADCAHGGNTDAGGGIHLSADNANSRDNVIFGNRAVNGGGVALGNSHVTLSDNTISGNSSEGGNDYGAGVY